MRAGVQRTCVRAFKERLGGGKTSRRKRREALTAYTCVLYVCVCVYVYMCLKRNIFLYYYSHRAYFSYPPTCIPGGWVSSFSPCLSFSVSLFLPLFLPSLLSSGTTGKIQPRTPSYSLFTCASPREIAWRVQRRARTEETEHIYVLSTLLLYLSLSPSMIERAIAAPALT